MKLTEKDLIAELRGLRRLPTPAYAAELDEWAAADFVRSEFGASPLAAREPRPKRFTRGLGVWPIRLGNLIPITGAVAAVALVAVVATSGVLGPQGSDDSASSGGAEPASIQLDSADVAKTSSTGAKGATGDAGAQSLQIVPTSGSAAAAHPEIGGVSAAVARRHVEQSASLALSASHDDVRDVSDGVVEVTDRYDGFVVSSSVQVSDKKAAARFDLRIPTAHLQAALSDLSGLAHVSSRDEGTLDVTAPYVSAKEQRQDAQAHVDSLLNQLKNADSATEASAIQQQLAAARADLARDRARFAEIARRTTLSKLSVSIAGDGGGDGTWGIGDAFSDAGSVLSTMTGIAIVTLAIVLPIAVIGFLLWLAWSWILGRRRERALDRN